MAELALFPLHTVLFPGGVLPLHIFEDRYRMLVREQREFGVVLIKDGREVGVSPDVHRVGTVADRESLEEFPDGRFALMSRGGRRFRILEIGHDQPYLTATIEYLPEPEPAPRTLLAALQAYLSAMGVDVILQQTPEMVRDATWLAGSILQVEAGKLQELLELGDPAFATRLLNVEVERLRTMGRTARVRPDLPAPN
ncbi:MAG: hypothetical protein NVS9B1_09370 [Candidatus Dormibacteraceae bacterium]